MRNNNTHCITWTENIGGIAFVVLVPFLVTPEKPNNVQYDSCPWTWPALEQRATSAVGAADHAPRTLCCFFV